MSFIKQKISNARKSRYWITYVSIITLCAIAFLTGVILAAMLLSGAFYQPVKVVDSYTLESRSGDEYKIAIVSVDQGYYSKDNQIADIDFYVNSSDRAYYDRKIGENAEGYTLYLVLNESDSWEDLIAQIDFEKNDAINKNLVAEFDGNINDFIDYSKDEIGVIKYPENTQIVLDKPIELKSEIVEDEFKLVRTNFYDFEEQIASGVSLKASFKDKDGYISFETEYDNFNYEINSGGLINKDDDLEIDFQLKIRSIIFDLKKDERLNDIKTVSVKNKELTEMLSVTTLSDVQKKYNVQDGRQEFAFEIKNTSKVEIPALTVRLELNNKSALSDFSTHRAYNIFGNEEKLGGLLPGEEKRYSVEIDFADEDEINLEAFPDDEFEIVLLAYSSSFENQFQDGFFDAEFNLTNYDIEEQKEKDGLIEIFPTGSTLEINEEIGLEFKAENFKSIVVDTINDCATVTFNTGGTRLILFKDESKNICYSPTYIGSPCETESQIPEIFTRKNELFNINGTLIDFSYDYTACYNSSISGFIDPATTIETDIWGDYGFGILPDSSDPYVTLGYFGDMNSLTSVLESVELK